MKFQPGHKKRGGRKKGTPNKRTRELMEILEEGGFCPVRALLQDREKALDCFAKLRAKKPYEANMYLKLAQDAAKDVMQYVYPKRKSIDAPKPEEGGAADDGTTVYETSLSNTPKDPPA